MKSRFNANFLLSDSKIKDILRRLVESPIGIVFFVDGQKHLKGIMTDGDVRRAILAGVGLDESAEKLIKKDFVYGKSSDSKIKNIKLLNDTIRHLPILDDDGAMVDFLSVVDFLRLPVMEPSLLGNELNYVADCIKSNWISSQGSYVKRFEDCFADYHGIAYSLTTCNGTTALHLALTALGIGTGDEVIVPDLTFAASANAVIHCGAKPVFVDVDKDYWNMDPNLLEKAITSRTKAVMPVHLYGHPCDMEPILEIAKKHQLYVVEDCAEALGARYKDKLVGTFGDVGCFSFFSNKVITTGEGGMVITADAELADKMEVMRNHGMRKEKRYWHELVGFNYRMTNLQAAVGLAQMEQIETFLNKRREIASIYSKNLKNLPGISLPPEMPWAKSVFWLYSILIDEQEVGISREQLILELQREGIETRPFFYPLHIQPPFYTDSIECAATEYLSSHGMSLPSGNMISCEEIERVGREISKIISNYQLVRQR